MHDATVVLVASSYKISTKENNFYYFDIKHQKGNLLLTNVIVLLIKELLIVISSPLIFISCCFSQNAVVSCCHFPRPSHPESGVNALRFQFNVYVHIRVGNTTDRRHKLCGRCLL